MANIIYKVAIDDNTISTLKMISFFKFEEYNKVHYNHIITYFIINNPRPMLRLNCYAFDEESKFHEFTINYIIDNKIAKYSHIEIDQYDNFKYYHIITFFDIIDNEILIKLI